MPKINISRVFVPYLFLFPALFLLALTVFFPALQAFYLSFARYEYDLTQIPQWVGLENFRRLWSDRLFWQTLRQTLLYLVCVVPVLVSLPLGLAILVDRQLRGIRWFRAAYYAPVAISMVVAGIAWKWLYSENGLLDRLLQLLGNNASIGWLTDPDLAIYSVMVVTVWKGLGYYMVIYLAGLQSIPKDLYEAASIDGSDGWRKHWDITVPLMRPYLMLVAIVSSISATKVFEEIFIMTQGGPRNSSKTIVYYIYERAFGHLDINYACAMALVLFLFVFSLSIANLALSRSQRRSPLKS